MNVTRPTIPPETAATQRRAADPANSAWVSANAGSGKTFVLTRRVVRLLLDGVAPSRILCLTFTKAAAAQMSIKVFETLAEWVTLDDAALAAAILETGAPRPEAADLAVARRLFARAVETPGGLKILTIHAFCEKLLHAFPFEANVAARFTVIDEIRQAELLSRAREAVLAEAVADADSPLGTALERLTRDLSSEGFDALLREMPAHHAALRATLREGGGPDGLARMLAQALGTDGRSLAEIERAITEDGLPRSEWDSIGRTLLSRGKGSPVGEALVQAARAPQALAVEAYLDVFFTEERTPKAKFLAKPIRAAEPALSAMLDAERTRLAGLVALRLAAAALERTLALVAVAGAVLDRYETLKRRRGLLDFADLIERSRALLARSETASAWVLYKLDAGIDHVLVDEAQDTSPEQWDILRAISRDFFAGEGQSRTNRTFFAVGDEKQSIYSFQGARPAMFDSTHQDFRRRATGAGLRFESVNLLLSFRSVETVLDVVDRVFAHEDNARGLAAGVAKPMPHQALKAGVPGTVEIWPPVGPAAAPEPSDWRLPVDLPEAHDPAVVLARRVAETIVRLTAAGSDETVDDGPRGRRPVRPGDVLILVRARNVFFEAVIRALKERRVPVAGADRLKLTEHIATMDLMAAGRAALLPDDDLTLACLLKSPLLGRDDDDLMRIAPGRQGSLADALRSSPHPHDREAEGRLALWRDRAATLTPFGFYTRLLGQDGGRKALLGRLGPEAGDVIDEFMALTLAHERDGAPSLLAFLARLEGTELSVKRDLEAAGDAVRVMTVHAAKGLEAKIVFLPDTCTAPNGRHDPKLFRITDPDGPDPALVVWSPRVAADPPVVELTREAGREAALDEHRRLLYVALTRAEERLYIAGFHGEHGPQVGSWHDMIVASGIGTTAVPAPWDRAATILRRSDPVPSGPAPVAVVVPPKPLALPDWMLRPARPERPVAPPLRPSTALGAADQPDRSEAMGDGARPRDRASAATGQLMHRLLQHLPDLAPVARRDAARRFLDRLGQALPPERRAALVDEALAVLTAPALAPLFGPGSRAEVAVAATVRLPGGESIAVTGQLDRIAVTEHTVFVADYKSGKPRDVEATPPSYLTQLALYRAAVRPLYPDRTVRMFLVWTAGPGVIEIDAGTLDAALAGLTAA